MHLITHEGMSTTMLSNESLFACLFQIEWRKLVDAVFLDKITDSEVFIVKVPSVLTKIDRVLSQTNPR